MLRKRSFFHRKRAYIIIASLVAVLLVLLILELTNTTHLLHKEGAVSGPIPVSSSSSSENQTQSSPDKTNTTGQATSSNPNPEKTASPPSSGTDLQTPSGSLVSNHQPSLKDLPAEESLCTSTPGATCKIEFTKDGVTKTLQAMKIGSSGVVIWNWDIKTAGFEEGSWKITAIATLNGSSKTTTDIQPLEVKP